MAPDPTRPALDRETPAVCAIPDDTEGFRLAERAVWHLLEKKGEDLVILDLRGCSDVCDFFVIASGTSATQVKALARHLNDALQLAGQRAQGLEGMNEGRWALLDFFDVVVHIFHADTRRYYNLEKLWGDAGRLDLDLSWFKGPAIAARHPGLDFAIPGAEDRSR